MNKQKKANGKRGIEWCDYTWNPIGGCYHNCRWVMPDGTVAVCYAEETAQNGPVKEHYPHGFEHYYWWPNRLMAPLRVKTPSKIFMDSMSDMMGHWVPDDQIERVLRVCRDAYWHTFQLLTKNAPRLLQFNDSMEKIVGVIPENVWVGVSSPPDFYNGKQLTRQQQERMLLNAFDVLSKMRVPVRWMSVEPLSWDLAHLFIDCPLNWVVIGAASNGPKYYQPQKEWVEKLLEVLDSQQIPVFFKGNLQWSPRREWWPDGKTVEERLKEQGAADE